MEKDTDQQLQWIQSNRTGWVSRRWPSRVGDVARQVLGSSALSGPAWRRRLLSLLEEHTDDEFLRQVAVMDIRDGVLVLHVSEPAVLYAMRVQWEQRLLTILQTHLPESGIHAVRFSTNRPK